MVTTIVNKPELVRRALESTTSHIILDLETSGLARSDQIVSAGLLVADQPFILFVRSRVIPNVTLAQFHSALLPLAIRTDLTIAGHNIEFDLGYLWREGIRVSGTAHCTEILLRLIDPDRGKNKDVLSARIDRLAPPGSPTRLNYKLKDTVPQLLNIRMVGYNNAIPMNVLPYQDHVVYLTSDLLGTKALYEYLISRATPEQLAYNAGFIAPLTPILVEMSETGIRANVEFLGTETARLRDLMDRISTEHRERFGCPLGMDQRTMCSWLFGELGLVPRKFKRVSARERALGRSLGAPALDTPHLEGLRRQLSVRLHLDASIQGQPIVESAYCTGLPVRYSRAEQPGCRAGDIRAAGSLDLIVAYRKTSTLTVGLSKLQPHVDYSDGRLHTSLNPRQATGRISSTTPNLQGIAKSKTIRGEVYRSRNALMASEGYLLVGFDVKNADIRAMAQAIATFPATAQAHTARLQRERTAALRPLVGNHLDQLPAHRNTSYRGTILPAPEFDPAHPCALRAILEDPDVDLYEMAARRVLGRETVTKDERNTFKQIVLSLSNSMGAASLARRLGYGTDKVAVERARGEQGKFWATFPQVYHYLELMRWQVALTGMTASWGGRTRVCTAHRWMVTLPLVEVLISYACGEWYWLDVIPLRPGRRTLTCWIRKVWDATYKSSNHGKLIYEDWRGPLCTRPYRLFQSLATSCEYSSTRNDLLYLLPVRNIAWRSIRRVRTESEESIYHGFDATSRSLINHIFQGGTNDILSTMLIRSRPLCAQYGARALLPIHDELLFECPANRATEFVAEMRAVLEAPPGGGWVIPIRVDGKTGRYFGEMREVK